MESPQSIEKLGLPDLIQRLVTNVNASVKSGELSDIGLPTFSENLKLPEELLREIEDFPPEQVAESLLENPPNVVWKGRTLRPTITTEPPRDKERKYLEDRKLKTGYEDISPLINKLKSYLALPRISDTFSLSPEGHQEERRPWESIVQHSLSYLPRKYRDILVDKYGNTKFSAGRIGTRVITPIETIPFLLNEDIQDNNVVNLAQEAQKLREDIKSDQKPISVFQLTDRAVNLAIGAMEAFTEPV